MEKEYKLSDFEYELPKDLIAQNPADFRDESKLLILNTDGKIEEDLFYNITEYVTENDIIVFNNSKVIRAYLALNKDDSEISMNLNKSISEYIWSAFAKPAKKLSEGDIFEFGENKIIIKEKLQNGEIIIEFDLSGKLSVFDFLEIYGSIPLPPYIKNGIADYEDDDRYQTIYCEKEGSVAAPTAGLHFTDEIFVQLTKKNIEYCFITLHVGAGTFLPVKTENIDEHKMHAEYAEISDEAAELINNAIKMGKRIIAVGTTSLRTLESFAIKNFDFENKMIIPGAIETDLFIKPGFDFKIVNALITNFHLPKSTLLMLVSAFSGYENIMKSYKHAIEKKYRFFSYGDAMFLMRNE